MTPRPMPFALAGLLPALVVTVLCTACDDAPTVAPPEGCSAEAPCPQGSTCVDRVCRGEAPECSKDADCAPGMTCASNTCVWPPLALDRLLPRSAPIEGGGAVVVSGLGFGPGLTVLFGSASATEVIVESATRATLHVPAGTVGLVDVEARMPDGRSALQKQAFSYFDPSVASSFEVGAILPASGPTTGGTRGIIRATGLVRGGWVFYDTTPARRLRVGEGVLTVDAPPHEVGPVDVTVVNGDGRVGLATPKFAYFEGVGDGPAIEAVVPSETYAGLPQDVEIVGTGFVAGALVFVDDALLADTDVGSPTSISVRFPVMPVGSYAVWVTNPDGRTTHKDDAWRVIPCEAQIHCGSRAICVSGTCRSVSGSTITATPAGLAAGLEARLEVVVRDDTGAPLANVPVTLEVSEETGASSTLGQPATPTGADGSASGTITSAVSGTATVQARAQGVLLTASTVVAFWDPPTARLTATPEPLLSGRSVTLSASDSIGGSGAAITSYAFDPGDGSDPTIGAASETTHAYDTAGEKTAKVTVTDAHGLMHSATTRVRVASTDVDPAASLLLADPIEVLTGESSTLTVRAFHTSGWLPAVGFPVTFASTGISGATITQPTDPTSATGEVKGLFVAQTPGIAVISARVGATDLPMTATVIVHAPPVPHAVITAMPDTVLAGETVTLSAAGSTAPTGATLVSYTFDAGDGSAPVTQAGPTLTHTYAAPGLILARVTVTDSRNATDVAGSEVIVSSRDLDVNLSTIAANPGSVPSDDPSTVTVKLVHLGGWLPAAGETVTLSATGIDGAVVTQPSTPTDASGTTTGKVRAPIPGTLTVRARVGAVPITASAMVTVTAPEVSAGLSEIAANPATFVAGVGSSTITVTAKRPSGAPAVGAPVTLTAVGASGIVITQPAAPTNANGLTTGVIRSAGAGTIVVSATASGTPITATATITATPRTVTSLVAITPTSFGTIGNVALPASLMPIVEVRDQDGVAMAGVTITWAVSHGTASGTTVISDTNGRATIGGWTPANAYGTGDAGWTQTVTASTAGKSVTFTVAVHGVWGFGILSGNNQLTSPGARTPAPIVLRSTDQYGGPSAGATVNCYSYGAHVVNDGPSTFVADASGDVRITTIRLDSSGLGGGFVCSPAVSRWGSSDAPQVAVAQPWSFTLVSGNGQFVPAGGRVPAPVVFALAGQVGEPIVGWPISCTPFAHTTLASSTFTSNTAGRVEVTGVSIDDSGLAGSFQCATSSRFGNATNNVSINVRQAASIVVSSGNSQRISVGAGPANPVTFLVTDQTGTALPGARVTCSAGANMTASSSPIFTGSNGTVALGPVAATKSNAGNGVITCVTPTASGQASTSVSFVIAKAASAEVLSGANQRVSPGAAAAPIVVRVLDDLGAPMPGVTLTVGEVSGAGGPAFTGEMTKSTGPDGTATFTGWVMGSPSTWNATPGQGLSILVAGVGSVGIGTVMRYAAQAIVATGAWQELKPGAGFMARAQILDQFGEAFAGAPIQWQCNEHCGVGSAGTFSGGDGFVQAAGLVLDYPAPGWPVAYQLSFYTVGGRAGGTPASGWICGVPSRPVCR